MRGRTEIGAIIRLMGAYIAFLIGAGFASGQEILQFAAVYGWEGVMGAALTALLTGYYAVVLLLTGAAYKPAGVDDIFTHFCGPKIGLAYAWFTTINLFFGAAMMIAGAGAVLTQFSGLPPFVGSFGMALAVFATVWFGLKEIVRIIGAIAPLLIGLLLLITILALIGPATGAPQEGSIGLKAAPNWWMAAILYASLQISALFCFLPALGRDSGDRPALARAGILAPAIYCGGFALIAAAEFQNGSLIQGKMIPMMALADHFLPPASQLFSVVILAGIYTTATPFLWVSLSKFAPDGTPRYRKLTAIMSVLAFAGSQLVPFDQLVNILLPVAAWSGILLLFAIPLRQIRTRQFV